MSETFSAGAAAFDAFRKRGRGGVLTSASIGYVIGMLVLVAGFLALTWSSLGAFGTAYYDVVSASMLGETISDPNDPRLMALMQSVGGVAGFGLIFIFFVYLLLAAFEAAVHRWLVRGETGGGLLGLNLGADTWRLYACYWIWFFVYLGLSLGIGIGLAVVLGVLGVALAGAQADPGMMIGLTILIMCVFYAALFYVLIRLAPATAVTVGLQRIAFFKAWTATRGRFWSMLGAFVLLFVVYLVIYALLAGAAVATVLGPMLGSFAGGAPPDAQTFLASLAQPATLAVLGGLYLVLLAAGMVFYVAFMGVNARAARVAIAEGRLGGAPAPAVS